MLSGPLVFVDIDTQRDFMEPAGALPVPGAVEIVPNLARLTRFASERGVPVLASADEHRADDPELAVFPPHCMAGTPGQERIEATACSETHRLGEEQEAPGELPRHLTLLKRAFDLFSNPRAGAIVERYNAVRPTFVVYGVATDYCVKAAVEGLLARDCRVALVVDAIRPIDPAAEAALLTDFARRGVLLTRSDAVCGGEG